MHKLNRPKLVMPWVLLILTAALLSGCKEEPVSAPSPTTNSAYLTSAKGRIDIEGGLVRLAAQREGVIERVLVEEGDRVVRGQLLAVLGAAPAQRSLEVTRAETGQARSLIQPLSLRLGSAERELARLKPLVADSVSQQELDVARDQVALLQAELATAKAAVHLSERREQVAIEEIEQRRVRAPMAGIIVRRSARPGDGVSISNVTPLFLFAPEAPFIVRADVEERWLSQLRIGQAAQVELEAEAGKSIPAKVVRIAPVVGQRPQGDDPAERQDVRVAEVVLALDAGSLRIGQRVIVRFPNAKAGS
jgi:HlyD family secretion protein